MMAGLFDTHCHLDDARFDSDREQVLARMREMGVAYAVVVGSDMASSCCAMRFAKAHDGIFAAVGIHPHEAKTCQEGDLAKLKTMLVDDKVVALGEIGLDFFYDYSERSVQRDVCIKQMCVAHECNMPVIYHVRDAHEEMLGIMRDMGTRLTEGIIHCFSGNVEIAKRYLDLGLYISFAGPVTYKKAPNQWEAASYVPLDKLLIETDSPYLSPEPMRGRRNEPGFVSFVAQKIAALKELTPDEIARITTENAKRIYRIGDSHDKH